MTSMRRAWGALAASAIVLAGCHATGRTGGTEEATVLASDGGRSAVVVRGTIGRSVEGREIRSIEIGVGPRTLLVIATIHGDEAAGTPLVDRWAEALIDDPLRLRGVTVVLVPDLNPDGRIAGRRGNMSGVDLNRNFEARNRVAWSGSGPRAESEPESRALARLLERVRPDAIVSIHQPLDCVDWDGPPETAVLAEAMSNASGLRVRRLGARPGSLGSWAGVDLGIPTVTFELPRDAGRDEDADYAAYAPALDAALGHVAALGS